MKTLHLFIFAFLSVAIIKANPLPVPPPHLELSEFTFDSQGKWVIELQYFNEHQGNTEHQIDSIFISSSTGRSKLTHFKIEDYTGIIMVCNDSLTSNLNFNPEGDSIQMSYYIHSEPNLTEPIVYGNFHNASLPALKTGQSIALSSNYSSYASYGSYSIDKSPTLEVTNDSTGMCGTLNGKIYDETNLLASLPNVRFYNPGLSDFVSEANGSFTTRAYSRNHHITQILIYCGYSYYSYEYLIAKINPINFAMLPDSVVTADIHITDIFLAVDEIKSNLSVFHIYPNPSKELTLNYETFLPVKSSKSYIEILSLNGQRIAQYQITENKGKINLPSGTINGVYTFRLLMNNKTYAATKIIIGQ